MIDKKGLINETNITKMQKKANTHLNNTWMTVQEIKKITADKPGVRVCVEEDYAYYYYALINGIRGREQEAEAIAKAIIASKSRNRSKRKRKNYGTITLKAEDVVRCFGAVNNKQAPKAFKIAEKRNVRYSL